eukprot:3409566-Pyramimonas_sp.AAC.1
MSEEADKNVKKAVAARLNKNNKNNKNKAVHARRAAQLREELREEDERRMEHEGTWVSSSRKERLLRQKELKKNEFMKAFTPSFI